MKKEIEPSWTRNEATPRSHVHVRRGLIFVLMWEDYNETCIKRSPLGNCQLLWLITGCTFNTGWTSRRVFQGNGDGKKAKYLFDKLTSTCVYLLLYQKQEDHATERRTQCKCCTSILHLVKVTVQISGWRQQNITGQELGKGNCVVQHQLIQVSFTVINEGL